MDSSIPNGVIIDPKPSDYVSGDGNLEAGLTNRVLVPDGDWTPYVPKGERQSGNGLETNNCTAFGYTNVIETQFKYYRKNGLIPIGTLQWLSDNGYLDENGDLNCSDRALGSMAGTTGSGNSLNVVAETARKCGLIPDSKWPAVFTTDAEYFETVPADLLALGIEFLSHFTLPYEQFLDTVHPLADGLKSAPLYVALCTCGGWNNPEPPPIAWCNAGMATNHCVCLLKQNAYRIFDSYQPFVKDFASNYYIPYFYRVFLTINTNASHMFLANDKGTVYVVTGNADKRKIGLADLNSLGLFGDEPQIPMDTSKIPEYNTIVDAKTITHK